MSAEYCSPESCTNLYYNNETSWRKAVLYILAKMINLFSGASVPATAATFEEMVEVSVIGAAYAAAVDLPDGTRSFSVVNNTDGDVVVSLDGGVTDHYYLTAASAMYVNVFELGLTTTAVIALKDGDTASANGKVRIYSIN